MNIREFSTEKWGNNKVLFIKSMIFTFIWGLVTHGYMFLNNSISHDSLNEFINNEQTFAIKMAVGRIFVPYYQSIFRGDIAVPWLSGILALIYIGFAVFLIAKMFGFHSNGKLLIISGIFAANLTVISAATAYINDIDADMMAMLLAVISVWLWKKYKYGFLVGIVPLVFTMGLYQSYLSVAITLVLFILILDLLQNKSFKSVTIFGLKAVAMIASAGLIYFISMKAILHFTATTISSGDYNSIDSILSLSFKEIIALTVRIYYYTIVKIFSPVSFMPLTVSRIVYGLMIIMAGTVIIKKILGKEIKIKEKILILLLTALIPLGMNICEVLANGTSHLLMHFSLWLVYLFVLLLIDKTVREKGSFLKNTRAYLCYAIILITLFSNVRMANICYLEKDYEKGANLSFYTELVNDMKEYDGYIQGETEVVFVGKPSTSIILPEKFEIVRSLTGMDYMPFVTGASVPSYFINYFKYVLMSPTVFANEEVWVAMRKSDETKQMSVYPAEGSMKMIDGKLVVKLG